MSPESGSPSQASLLLQKQLKHLCRHPIDGFSAGLIDESNVFEWNVTIMGPPDTLYSEGYFNAVMTFPSDYPVNPPSVRFVSEIWHPNVYADGKVCISILHPPGNDPNGYELASERWSPVHTVESIVLSIISMLSSPNDESPANVDAAVEWRERKDQFKKKVGRCVRKSQEAISVIASYLKASLRYPLRLGGSRSYICDFAPSVEPTLSDLTSISLASANSKRVEFPLFLEGQDTTRSAYAVFLLNKDLEQLLNFIGVESLGPRHVLANLKELLNTLLA